jgi:hypothetical protein
MAHRILFKTAQDFAEFVPIGKEMDSGFTKLPAQIHTAQMTFLVKEIGSAFLTELLTAYLDGTPSVAQAQAILRIQAPLANYTTYLFLPKHKLQIDSQGVRVNENQEQKDAKPFDMNQALEAYLRDAYTGIEQVLEYLEANKASYSTWASSKEYTAFSKATIRTCTELEQATGIPVTRRLFRFIKPHISRCENQLLNSILGKPLLEEILTQIQAGTVSEANQALLDIARPAVAFTALADTLSLVEVEMSDLGITVLSSAVNSLVARGKSAAPDSKIQNMASTCQKLGPEQLANLHKFIIDNAADYPLFTAPESYAGGARNTDGSGIFSAL